MNKINYSQLHREALALVFGVKKFHKYIYGRQNLILQTDHLPLEAIFGSKKGIPSLAAAHLQRWSIIMLAHDVKVKYRKTADVSHADAFSRLPLPDTEQIELEANYISHVEQCIQVFNCRSVSQASSITSLDIGRLTKRDPVRSRVKHCVMYGWREFNNPELSSFLRNKN